MAITYPALAMPLKFNSGFINLLPKFLGKPGEDPYRHISEFIITYTTIQQEGVTPDQVKLRAFPFTLQNAANDWLHYLLPPGSVTSWEQLHKAFLEKFSPASRIGAIRKEIFGIKQHSGETLYEYWEHFNKLCASCPMHQICEQLLIQHLYEGLLSHDKGMIDVASGRALVDKTPVQARDLISNMAQNSQQFEGRSGSCIQPTNDKNAKLAQIQAMLSQLMSPPAATICCICTTLGHATNQCPILQPGEVNALYNNNNRRYDPFAPTYNEGWKDHPNLRYGPPRNCPP